MVEIAPRPETLTEVDVTVTPPDGTTSTGDPDQFTYDAIPSVTRLAPNSGPLVGGTAVTLTQSSPTSASVTNNVGYNGQLAVANGTGTLSYTETTSAASVSPGTASL